MDKEFQGSTVHTKRDEGNKIATVSQKKDIRQVISWLDGKEVKDPFLLYEAEVTEGLKELIRNSENRGRRIIFDLPCFDSCRRHYEEEKRRILSKTNMITGFYACKKCKSQNTRTTIIQMARGDEADTHITECFNCGYRWSET
ncbi:MAG: hypothetical protein KatS3mg101_0847 [Patescibacteria group bacterium]|nr:MAG: hypothetical protein KatS3mg101_0847 [Patescibacteria group bacterium]